MVADILFIVLIRISTFRDPSRQFHDKEALARSMRSDHINSVTVGAFTSCVCACVCVCVKLSINNNKSVCVCDSWGFLYLCSRSDSGGYTV